MNEEQNLITREGYESLQMQLEVLQTVDRKQAVEEITHARGFGDSTENAELTCARERQEQVETKISEIAEFMKTCAIIEANDNISTSEVGFGRTVTALNLETENSVIYRIVGITESDPKQGKISYKSPLGRALLGRKIGEEFDLITPRGESSWEVTGII